MPGSGVHTGVNDVGSCSHLSLNSKRMHSLSLQQAVFKIVLRIVTYFGRRGNEFLPNSAKNFSALASLQLLPASKRDLPEYRVKTANAELIKFISTPRICRYHALLQRFTTGCRERGILGGATLLPTTNIPLLRRELAVNSKEKALPEAARGNRTASDRVFAARRSAQLY